MKHILTLAALAVLMIASCKKDKDGDNPSPNAAATINGTWAFVAMTSDKPSGGTSGDLLIFDNCKKSNENDPWLLQNGVLTIDGKNYQVVQLDKTALRFTSPGGEYGDIELPQGHIKRAISPIRSRSAESNYHGGRGAETMRGRELPHSRRENIAWPSVFFPAVCR